MKRAPKIILIGNFLSNRRGLFSQSEDFAQMLRQYGCAVVTASPWRSPILRAMHMLFSVVWWKNWYDVAIVDMYSGRAFAWCDATVCLLRFLRKPVILVLHGGGLPGAKGRQRHRMEGVIAGAAAVVTPSPYMIPAAFSHIRPDICSLPNGLPISHYSVRVRDGAKPQMVWLRAFHHIYQPWCAVDVLAHVLHAHPGATLTMIGPDKGDGSMEHVRKRADELRVSHALRIMSGVPKCDVPLWLARADIFLNTTTLESFGVAVMEAAACGLCVVTTDAGDLPWIWTDGENASVVPVGDVERMAAAVLRIVDDPQLAQRLSLRARETAMRYDWSHIWPQWQTILERVACIQGDASM